ncbi:MAG: hypothetical protein HQL91_10765 [Magnetococcales bacterium]|nr:hypothetical protein [Magnetococcales bacterium]
MPAEVTTQQHHSYALCLEAQFQAIHALRMTLAVTRFWQAILEAHCRQPLHDTIAVARLMAWSVRHPVTQRHAQPGNDTTTVPPRGHARSWALLERNPLHTRLHACWNLAPQETSAIRLLPQVAWDRRPLPLLAATLSWSPASVAWVARLVLADDARFVAISLNQPLELTWDTLPLKMIVTAKEHLRAQSGPPQRVVIAMGLPIRHESPLARRITRDWTQPVWARDAVEEALQESVTWMLPAWRVPAGRLSVQEEVPMAVARRLAQAVGGVVRSDPAGRVILAPRHPRPVPEWEQGEPDHWLTDATDLLASRAEGSSSTGVNRITVSESLPELQPPGLWLERDPATAGAATLAEGQSLRLLTLASPGVTLRSRDASGGNWLADETATRFHEEELAFPGTCQALLSRPARKIVTVTWLGRDLGEMKLAADGRTVTTAQTGVALARIRVALSTQGVHAFQPPTGVAHALLTAQAEVTRPQGLRLVLSRASSDRSPDAPWHDQAVASPLLADPVALRARALAELDDGENLQNVRLTLVHRPEIRPGALVEVHDGWFGAGYRGVVIRVTHEITPERATSQLEVVRRAG